jgi:hypothetical protein
VVKLSRPRAFRRCDWTSYGCDRQKKGRPGDLRDTMIAGIALPSEDYVGVPDGTKPPIDQAMQ